MKTRRYFYCNLTWSYKKSRVYSVYSFMNIFGKWGTGIPKELTYLGSPKGQWGYSKFTFQDSYVVRSNKFTDFCFSYFMMCLQKLCVIQLLWFIFKIFIISFLVLPLSAWITRSTIIVFFFYWKPINTIFVTLSKDFG